MQLEDWLDDLCVRFIINIPQEELVQLERICFQIEEAQWFYEDFIRPLDPKLPSLGLKPFFQRIISRCPVFKDRPHEDWASAYDRFILYKNRVPVRGAILLNDQMDQILLVKGWKKHATWSFPRGKINKDEADIDCAIREAWEETGFDIKSAGLVKDSRKVRHIEKTLRDQSVKLFVFRGVPTDYNFVPQTRKEISKCEWYKIADLPTSAKAKAAHHEGTGQHLALNANKFYMVAPFVQELKKIINQFKKGDHRQSSKLAAPPTNVDMIETAPMAEQTKIVAPDPHTNMSPAVPSTLPEVTPTSAQDKSLQLKQQSDILQAGHLDNSNPAMSNALLNLLRGTPAAEMRNDPPTPMEQASFSLQPVSPERSTHPASAYMQSPPAVFETQGVAQSVASPSSAIPQLNQHARSLLDTLNQPKTQSPALEARQILPPSKQDLLAAFMSTSRSPANAQPDLVSSGNHGNDLLQMLQRKQNTSEAATQTATVSEAEGSVGELTSNATLPIKSAQSHQIVPHPLLDLFKSSTSTVRKDPPMELVPRTAEAPANERADLFRQVEPAELSATSDHENKTVPVDTMKANILSMLGAIPQKSPRTVEKDKIRKSSTAATLSGPIVQPQFDAVKAPVSEDDMKRPTTGQRKLFDPRDDEFKPAPTKVLSRNDDRNRQTKSQRGPKQQKANFPGRPATQKEAKEVPKPFQPQILKRPQTADGEPSPFTITANPTVSPIGLAATMTTQSPDQAFISTTSRSQAPKTEETSFNPMSPTSSVAATVTPKPKPTVPQDPQREALLSLLRTPTQMQTRTQPQKPGPATVDAGITPQPPLVPFTARHPTPIAVPTTTSVSPPVPFAPSQIVSPVNETDPFASRSRVSSLASIGNGFVAVGKEANVGTNRPTIEKRQTAAGDKAFLMNYLRGFANQGQETS